MMEIQVPPLTVDEVNFVGWPEIQVLPLMVDKAQALCKVPIMDKIENVVKSLGPWKAPGPNGIHAVFFHRFWSVIKEYVSNNVIDLLVGTKILPHLISICYQQTFFYFFLLYVCHTCFFIIVGQICTSHFINYETCSLL